MATMIVKHKVADFNTWKTFFDSDQQNRIAAGWIRHDLLRDSADPNLVTIVGKTKSLDQARAFASSPKLKETMQSAGVISQPEVSFLEDSETVSY